MTKTNINKVLVLQKKIVRIIANVDNTTTSKYAFEAHNIVRVNHLYNFKLLQKMYFSTASIADFYSTLASLDMRRANINTRTTNTWNIPRFRTNYKLQMLSYNLPHVLNTYKHTIGYTKAELRKYFVEM